MNKQDLLAKYQTNYSIVGVVDLDEVKYSTKTFTPWLMQQLRVLRKDYYENNERIIIFIDTDYYQKKSQLGLKLQALQETVNLVDISNFFCLLVTGNPDIDIEVEALKKISIDPVPIQIEKISDIEFSKIAIETTQAKDDGIFYRYSSTDLAKMSMDKLTEKQTYLLTESKNFCMYPWVHLHAHPTGKVFPCCGADPSPGPVGDARVDTLETIWNNDNMKDLRKSMLSETWSPYCVRCYEQENSGFFSMRNEANRNLGHYIEDVDKTLEDGTHPEFKIRYWDVRFSNLCNFKCRMCCPEFSSSWGSEIKKVLKNSDSNVIQQIDVWDEIEPLFDIVEEIIYKIHKKNPGLKIKEVPFLFRKRMFGETKRNLFLFIFKPNHHK